MEILQAFFAWVAPTRVVLVLVLRQYHRALRLEEPRAQVQRAHRLDRALASVAGHALHLVVADPRLAAHLVVAAAAKETWVNSFIPQNL